MKCFTIDTPGGTVNNTMTNAMKMLIEELSQIPEQEQEKVAMPLLNELQELRKSDAWPLADMIGSGAGLYESPEEVDKEIHNL